MQPDLGRDPFFSSYLFCFTFTQEREREDRENAKKEIRLQSIGLLVTNSASLFFFCEAFYGRMADSLSDGSLEPVISGSGWCCTETTMTEEGER